MCYTIDVELMEKALNVDNLSKNYGNFAAVKGIGFSIEANEIFGLVGPNGAGKSTTLKMVATIMKPSGGTATVYGVDIGKDPERVRQMISYLPEDAGAYKSLTGLEYLRFMAAMYTDDRTAQKAQVEFAREICGLGERLKDKVKTYSKGMTRKLLLARAVMARPKLAIMDEPTSGLDVVNAVMIRETIKRLAGEGMAVLLSSHNMLEVEFLSHRVALIGSGEIRACDTPAALKEKYRAANLEEVFMSLAKSNAS